jgi:rubrerythrin
MDLSAFRIEEMYQFAVAIEQGGYDFYTRLIEACESPRARNELKFLKDEEARHKAFFSGQLKKKGFDTEVALNPALDSFLTEQFVAPMEQFYKEKKITRTDEALRFGAAVEQKTIDFYVDMRSRAGDAGVQKDLDAIIEEEKKHKLKLNVILTY